jgi:hypothetical protein
VKVLLIVSHDDASVRLRSGSDDGIKATTRSPACFRFSHQSRPYESRRFVEGKDAISKKTLRPLITDKPALERSSLLAGGLLQDAFRARRRLVNTLIREGGMIAPDAMLGDIVEALADGGLFRLRGVLIETVAFQCY